MTSTVSATNPHNNSFISYKFTDSFEIAISKTVFYKLFYKNSCFSKNFYYSSNECFIRSTERTIYSNDKWFIWTTSDKSFMRTTNVSFAAPNRTFIRTTNVEWFIWTIHELFDIGVDNRKIIVLLTIEWQMIFNRMMPTAAFVIRVTSVCGITLSIQAHLQHNFH